MVAATDWAMCQMGEKVRAAVRLVPMATGEVAMAGEVATTTRTKESVTAAAEEAVREVRRVEAVMAAVARALATRVAAARALAGRGLAATAKAGRGLAVAGRARVAEAEARVAQAAVPVVQRA